MVWAREDNNFEIPEVRFGQEQGDFYNCAICAHLCPNKTKQEKEKTI